MSEETFRRALGAPIYEELARTWREAGRAVPGQPDPVWEALVSRPGRHRSRPVARPGVPKARSAQAGHRDET